MNPRFLRTFVVAAARLNFTRAAADVNLSPSTVTEQIQSLESDLGAALFDRSARTLSLTAAGEVLRERASAILSQMDETRAEIAAMADTQGGALTIGALETLSTDWLAPMVARFRAAEPAAELRLKIAGSGTLRSDLVNGDLGAAFMFDGLVAEATLKAVPVGRAAMAIIVAEGHELAARTQVSRGELAKQAFVVTEQGCVYRQMFERAFPPGSAGRPSITAEVGSLGTIRQLVKAGMGVAFVPALTVSHDAGVVALASEDIAASVPILMCWRRGKAGSAGQRPLLRRFLAFVHGMAAPAITPDGARPRHEAPSR